MTASSVLLIRFVTDGLLATIDAHLAGTLPLHRFAWELRTRIDALAALDTPRRVVTRLRWMQRAVENLHAELRARIDIGGEAKLTRDEENSLVATVATLRTVLATLAPHNPVDPCGAGHAHTWLGTTTTG